MQQNAAAIKKVLKIHMYKKEKISTKRCYPIRLRDTL